MLSFPPLGRFKRFSRHRITPLTIYSELFTTLRARALSPYRFIIMLNRLVTY